MADSRHCEKRFWHNSSNNCPISVKFSNRKQNNIPTKVILKISKIQDSWQPSFWK